MARYDYRPGDLEPGDLVTMADGRQLAIASVEDIFFAAVGDDPGPLHPVSAVVRAYRGSVTGALVRPAPVKPAHS